MGKIFETVLAFFKEDPLNQWNFIKDEELNLLRLTFGGDNSSWAYYAQALEEDQQFAFYSVLSNQIPPEKRQVVAEFLTRANYSLIIGNFEMDYTDGEVRYKTSIDVEGDRLSPALVKQIVYSNLYRANQYLPGLLDVIQANKSPAEAILKVENG
jgi:hypothetical protein